MRLFAFLRAGACSLAAAALPIGCSPAADVSGAASDGLVFVRQTEEGTDLFRVRLADGAIERLTRTERNEDWSDRAGRLAFLTAPGEGRPT